VPVTLQAPVLLHGPLRSGFDAQSYPELLLDAGYGNPATLASLVRAWLSLFRLGGVDAVVADFAPTAMLAARVADLPVMHVGDGFTMPPDATAAMSFKTGGAGDQARFHAACDRVLGCVNRVLEQSGAARLAGIDELTGARIAVLATYPELDHYRGCARGIEFSGHFDNPGEPDASWRPVPGPRILAYLKPTGQQFESVVEVLRRLPVQTRIYAAGMVRPDDSRSGLGLAWSAEPIAFSAAVAGADLVLSHAGHGATCAALLAGRPLCMLPTSHEQLLTSRNVEALGAGRVLLPTHDAKHIGRAIVRGVDDPGMRSAAADFAARHAAHTAGAAVRLAETADRFLALVKAASPA
jgi:UDP:flavonoid glycosyltransferase YjiC (YdhE family)